MLYKHALLDNQLKSYSQSLNILIEQRINNELNAVAQLRNLLQSYSPNNVLKRGFAIIQTTGDKLLKGVECLSAGEIINIKMHDGEVSAEVKAKPILIKRKAAPQ
jgi:exonuclease VII large subunit